MQKNVIYLSYETLKRILIENLPFRIALDSVTKKFNLEKSERHTIASIVGAELRHHLVFTYLTDQHFVNASLEEKLLFCLSLANNIFAKKVDEEECKNDVLEELEKIESDITETQYDDFMTKVGDAKTLIPDDIEKESIEYASYRFNTPMWLVKMWRKHFGLFFANKILLANTKLPKNVARVNTLNTTAEEVLNNPNFSPSPIDDALFYDGKENLGSTKEVKDYHVFPSSLSSKYILDTLDLQNYETIALYQGASGKTFYLELVLKQGLDMKLELMFKSPRDYSNYEKNYYGFELTNTSASIVKGDFITHISSKVNVFIIYAESSSFSEIRTSPDYLIHFKQESIDELIEREKYLLNSAKEFIQDDGKIVYIVDTLSRKEGRAVINNFLSENKDYILIEERQFFPFDKYNSSTYFAILQKGVKDD